MLDSKGLESKYKKLKRQADTLSRQVSRLQGQLDNVLEDLATEFGVHTIEEAEQLLSALIKKEESQRATLEKRMVQFEKEWGSVLQETDS